MIFGRALNGRSVNVFLYFQGDCSEISGYRPLGCKVDVDSITLTGGKPKYLIDCTLRNFRGVRSMATKFSPVKGPPFVWTKDQISKSNLDRLQMNNRDPASAELFLVFCRKDGLKSLFGKRKICQVGWN